MGRRSSVESMFALRGRSKFNFCSLRLPVGQIKGKLVMYAPMNHDFLASLHRDPTHKSFFARKYSLKYSILSTVVGGPLNMDTSPVVIT